MTVFLVALGFSLLFLGLISSIPGRNDGRNESMFWHRFNGKFQVIYPDGQISQPFSREVARDYASIFGGVVVKKRETQVEADTAGGAE
jgi:hypothetical protein